MASKLKWAYATKEQAAAKGISAQKWEQSKNALSKIENLFVDKLQGTRGALKNAILKGKAGGLNGIDEETDLSGLGILPAAALAAAIPVITSALKILTNSGIMKKDEAQNIEDEVKSKTSEADKMANDPDLKNNSQDASSSSASASGGGSASESSGGSSTGGGIIGFVKKQPLLAIGGAALGIWGLTKLFGGKKSSSHAVSGIPGKKRRKQKAKNKAHPAHTRNKGKRRLKSITLS